MIDCARDRSDFVGRDSELTRLRDLVKQVRAGTPQLVFVRGQPGIGKTTMIRRFLAELTGFTVLHANADASESELSYGLIDQLGRCLPPATRSGVPLLTSSATSHANPLAVGAQLLDVLGPMQSRGSVALVVDDVQWADAASIQALGFVLRRVLADSILTVLISRPATDGHAARLLDLLTRVGSNTHLIELSGLDGSDIVRLSYAMSGRPLPAAVAERLRVYTGGSPLYLRALLTDLPDDAASRRTRRIAVPSSLVSTVRGVLERLPPSSRELLETLAVLGTRSSLARVAKVSGVPEPNDALPPALNAGLARWWPHEEASPVDIVHELQREAIYTGLSPTRRSALHARAAAVVDRQSAWAHRVAAATTVDEALAAELEAAAAEQVAERQHSLAATYLMWSAELSAVGADYERRLLTAAVQMSYSDDRARALRLRPEIEQCAPSALRSLALGMITLLGAGQWMAAQAWLSDARQQSDEHVPRWIPSTAAAWIAGVFTLSGQFAACITAAQDALADAELPTLLQDYTRVLLAVGVSRRHGMAAGLAELGHLSPNPSAVPVDQLDTLACRGAFHAMLGNLTDAKRDLEAVVRQNTMGTFLFSGTIPHCYLAAVHYQLDEWDESLTVMQRVLVLDDTEEQPQNQTMRRLAACLVPAARGDWDTAAAHVQVANRLAQRSGAAQDLRYAAIAEAMLHQAQGDHAGMLAAVRHVPGLVHGPGLIAPEQEEHGVHEWWGLWWRPLLIEALLETGELDNAAAQLAGLCRVPGAGGYPAATVLRLTARLQHATGEFCLALRTVTEFLDAPPPGQPSLATALLEHDHGDRLLTVDRPAEAMSWLLSAKRRLARLGAIPFERRVDADLQRCGIHVPDACDQLAGLTERERDVARLVAHRLTNREVAARLYVTMKTVEYHLGNVYAKLGITSRRQLIERLSLPALRTDDQQP